MSDFFIGDLLKTRILENVWVTAETRYRRFIGKTRLVRLIMKFYILLLFTDEVIPSDFHLQNDDIKPKITLFWIRLYLFCAWVIFLNERVNFLVNV